MASSKTKSKFAGSSEFTNGLTQAKDPFSANAKRSKQEAAYKAYENRGYDDLSNLETYKAAQQYNQTKEDGRFDTQDAARSSLKTSGFTFDGDLSNYDSKAAGGKGFNMSDVNYLKRGGASDEAIAKHVSSLDKVGESLRNNSAYGGSHYRGDMDKSKGIEQYDMGKGFNISDIKYLQRQGYDDKAITDYGLSTGKGHGVQTAKFLEGQSRLDTRARNTFDNRMGPNNETEYKYVAPDLSEERARVDEVMKDNFSKHVDREDKLIANSPNEHNSQKFFEKHLAMARASAASRKGLDLSSQYNSGFKLDINALDKHIRRTPLYSEAKSELEGLKIFGDRYRNSRENPNKWAQASPMEAVKSPDFQSIYEQTRDDIDKIKI